VSPGFLFEACFSRFIVGAGFKPFRHVSDFLSVFSHGHVIGTSFTVFLQCTEWRRRPPKDKPPPNCSCELILIITPLFALLGSNRPANGPFSGSRAFSIGHMQLSLLEDPVSFYSR